MAWWVFIGWWWMPIYWLLIGWWWRPIKWVCSKLPTAAKASLIFILAVLVLGTAALYEPTEKPQPTQVEPVEQIESTVEVESSDTVEPVSSGIQSPAVIKSEVTVTKPVEPKPETKVIEDPTPVPEPDPIPKPVLVEPEPVVIVAEPEPVTIEEPVVTEPVGINYVVNTNTGKFHKSSCGSAKSIKSSNRWDYCGTRDYLISQGYSPCGKCKP